MWKKSDTIRYESNLKTIDKFDNYAKHDGQMDMHWIYFWMVAMENASY